MTYFVGVEDEARKKMANTTEEVLEIAARTTIFPAFHSPDMMKKYFRAIQELKTENASDDDRVRKLDWLERTLKDIQKRIKKYQSLASSDVLPAGTSSGEISQKFSRLRSFLSKLI